MDRFCRMARSLSAAVLLLAGLALASSVSAHAVKECGAYGYDRSGDGPKVLRDGELDGAGTFNITARGVSCGTGHRIVKRWSNRCRRSVCYVGTFRCRTRRTGYELADTRCTTKRSRHYVVRWQSGA